MVLRSSEGISVGEIYLSLGIQISDSSNWSAKSCSSTYSDIMRCASSAKDKSRHSDSHEEDKDGISSGINRPPSEASPFMTTSSKER